MALGRLLIVAAVAAAAVLGVTEPYSCGIGGGGFMVIRTAGGKVTTIDSREESPATMQPDSFWENGAALPFNDARWSGLSAGVPGTVAGWDRALRRYGTWPLGRALGPGIAVASDGFTVDRTFVSQTEPNVDWFDDVPSTAAIYLDPDGTPRDEGSTLRNPDLADTYRRIARSGAGAFYRGAIAEAMVDAAQNPPIADDANHRWRPGLMTLRDLRGYAARNAYLADPDFFDVPLSGLLSDSFAAERRDLIHEHRAATSPVAPGDPYDNQGDSSRAAHPSATISHPRQSTTHLVVSDRQGNVVSYTFTIESTGGNGIVVPGYGFLLNNELTDFNFDSTTHPNRADRSKRPRSSMSPTIITRDGEPFIAVGSPGGSTIPPTVLQVLLERLDLGSTLPEAIARPRASQRNTPTWTTIAEPAFAPEKPGLTARGHVFG